MDVPFFRKTVSLRINALAPVNIKTLPIGASAADLIPCRVPTQGVDSQPLGGKAVGESATTLYGWGDGAHSAHRR
jgi:hypothetical protein